MMAFLKWISSKWWPIAVGFSIAAVAYIRFAEAGDHARRHWTRVQADDLAVARQESQMRYFCVGGMAFDMGKGNEPVALLENRITMVDSRTKKRCLPPWAEAVRCDEILMSATSESGWASTLIKVDEPLPRAVAATKRRLERLGWRETAASTVAGQNRPSVPGFMFEKGGSWLLASAVYNSDEGATDVLLSGRFEP